VAYKGFQPLQDERMILTKKPHPFAMLDISSFWLLLSGIGVAHFIYYPEIATLLRTYLHFDFAVRHTYHLMWFLSVLVPLTIMAIFRVSFRYISVLLLLVVANIALQWKVAPRLNIPLEAHPHLGSYLLIIVGLIGIAGSEVYRRGHRYFITNKRVISRFGVLRRSERMVLYSKIDDLLTQKGGFGGLFNFGTVIPITSSGIGTGQDSAHGGAMVGGGKMGLGAGMFAGGSKSQTVPRALAAYVVFKVSNPEEVAQIIIENMEKREYVRDPQGR
jgi:membrane protein YdbS with pleckstrin-like domain